MKNRSVLTKVAFILFVTALIILNLFTFIAAYPETYTSNPGINTSGTIIAKDFSAYYIGAWRLWSNPSKIYTFGSLNDGEPDIAPHPEEYKYLPNFLLLTSPLIFLNYQDALFTFDIIQFLLLPVMAYFLYKILEDKAVVAIFAVATIALLLPFPSPNKGFSLSYYWQWGEGQAKVISTFLFLFSFYLGKKQKPVLSGIPMAFGFFDPRFGLLALPLFIVYNHKNFKNATVSFVVASIASNLMLIYPSMFANFTQMIFTSGASTPFYYYSLIPLLTLVALIVVKSKDIANLVKLKNPIK